MSRPACRSAGVTNRIALCKCSVLYQCTKAATHARAASRSANGCVGNAGRYFNVRKSASENGLSLLTPGRLNDGEDAQALQRDDHRRALHRAAVIGVQHDARRIEPLRATDREEEGRRTLRRFHLVHGPADNLPTPDVEHQIQIVEDAAHRRFEIRDVPAPELVRARRHVRARRPAHRRLRAAAMLEQPLLAENPIDGGLRGEIAARIGELRHDLMRRQLAIRGRRHDRENRRALAGRELIRRPMMRAMARIGVEPDAPAFDRAHAEAHEPTGRAPPRAGEDRGPR